MYIGSGKYLLFVVAKYDLLISTRFYTFTTLIKILIKSSCMHMDISKELSRNLAQNG